MAKVVLLKCETYENRAVKKVVEHGIELLGGPEKFAKQGEKILLKPNLLVADPPKKCVTTNPSIFKAVAEVFLSTGAIVSYGDSPAAGNSFGAAKKAGLVEVAKQLKIDLADFKTGEKVFFKEGVQNKRFVIAKGIVESDGIISLPKLKTHGLERMTCCVKNQFGCIPGVRKGEFHVRLPDPVDFGRMLVDLNRFINPRLYIVDGVFAMEGNGPRGGKPIQMNLIAFSEDPIALDATICRLVDLDPEYVPTIKFGSEFGAGTYLEEDIELIGDSFDGFKKSEFDVERLPVSSVKVKFFRRFLRNRISSKPYIVEDSCAGCGVCVSMCPAQPKAVNWFDGDKNKAPTYNYEDCIRCYCCQEMCPESAIKLKAPALRKFLNSRILRLIGS